MFSEYRKKIDDEIAGFFESLPSRIDFDLSADSKRAVELLKEYSLRPGKRIRGSLAAFAYDYVKKTSFGVAGLKLGVALELVQNYLLIIDDVMDKSETRRGEPTIHLLYTKEPAVWASDDHTTTMLAINVGLIAQHLASIIVSELPEEGAILNQISRVMHKNILGTGFGQLDDLSQQIGQKVTEEDIVRKYLLKSSYYTYINPLQTGLILGGVADQVVLDEVREFGSAAGIAFQLFDDYLGIYGDDQKTGKSNLDDIKEGKYTLQVQYALAHASEQDVKTLHEILGNDSATSSQGNEVRAILTHCGAQKYLLERTQSYAEQAKKQLETSIIWDSEAQDMLKKLVDFTVSRDK